MNVEVDVTQYVEDILSDISCWISISLFNNLSCDLLCWCTVVISGGNLGLPCSFTIAIVRKLLIIHISFFSFSFLFLVIYFQERGGPGELGCVIVYILEVLLDCLRVVKTADLLWYCCYFLSDI